MKHTKRILSYIMALSIVCSMSVPTFAEENDFALPAEAEAAVTELDDTSSEADTAEIEEYAATDDTDVSIAGWKQHNTDPLCDGFHYQEKADGTIMITGSDKTNPNIVIPTKLKGKAVTEISEYAFYRYEEIESVSVPSSVKKINNRAFANCPNLKSITISGVKNIDECICYNDTALDEIILEGNIDRIGGASFFNASAKKVYVPKTVLKVEGYAFGYEPYYWDPEEDGNLVEDYTVNKNFTLECETGSAAYHYAVKHNINYTTRDNFKVGSTKITSAKMVGSNSLKLTWKKPKNASGYKVQIIDPNTFYGYKTLKVINNANTTGYTVKGMKAGKANRVMITPFYKDKYIKVFGDTCDAYFYRKPSAAKLIAASGTSNSAIIRFEKNDRQDISGIRIERYDYKKKKWVKHLELRGSDYFGSNIVTYKNNAAYIKLKDLKPNTKYKFRVRLSVAEFDGNKPISDVFGKTIKYSPWSNSKVITTKK